MKEFIDIKKQPKANGKDERYTVIETIGRDTLIYRHTTFLPWVVAHGYHPELDCWDAGDYLPTIEDAMLFILKNRNPNAIISAAMQICDQKDKGDIADMLMQEVMENDD